MKLKKSTIVGIILVAVVIVATFLIYNYAVSKSQEETGYMDVTPIVAKALIDDNPDLTIIDVSPDYANGHLPGAVSYYLGDGSLDAAIPNLDPNAKYLVYCHFETASRAGAQKLVDAGFTNVYRLDGEYDAWVNAGYAVE